MPAETDLAEQGEPGSVHSLQLVIPADAFAVRTALVRMCDALILRSLSEEQRGTVEIVLAEVLNNIVEHAYATEEGQIEITLRRAPESLFCQIVDQGRRMPGNQLPEGTLPPVSPDNPPEGGFGWHLIRSLSQELAYSHSGGRNRLTFRLGMATVPGQSA